MNVYFGGFGCSKLSINNRINTIATISVHSAAALTEIAISIIIFVMKA